MNIRFATAVLASITTLGLVSTPAFAQDSALLFKTKCAMCHGDQGQGKPPMAPKIAGTTRNVVDVLTKGGEAKAPHIKPMGTVTADQASALAAFVKSLK